MTSTQQKLPFLTASQNTGGEPVMLGKCGAEDLRHISFGIIFNATSNAPNYDDELCAFVHHREADGVPDWNKLVFFNNPEILEGAVRLARWKLSVRSPYDDALHVNTAQITEGIERIEVAAFFWRNKDMPMDAHFGHMKSVELEILNAEGEPIASFEFAGNGEGKTGAILGDLFRKDGEWIFQPSGQARTGWLPSLCRKRGMETRWN